MYYQLLQNTQVGNKISTERYVMHVSDKKNRESILKNGLVRKPNDIMNYAPAIFAQNSIVPAYFWHTISESLYLFSCNVENWSYNAHLYKYLDNWDFWRIDTLRIPNQWHLDDYTKQDQGIVTLDYDIPVKFLALFEAWSGDTEMEIVITEGALHMKKNYGLRRIII